MRFIPPTELFSEAMERHHEFDTRYLWKEWRWLIPIAMLEKRPRTFSRFDSDHMASLNNYGLSL